MSFHLEFILENDTKNIIVQSNTKRMTFFKSELDWLFHRKYSVPDYTDATVPAGWVRMAGQSINVFGIAGEGRLTAELLEQARSTLRR